MVSGSESSYLSHLNSEATLPDPVSAELLKASLEYMRTPSPELQEAGNVGQYWIVDSIPAHSCLSSSPILSCPPSWLHDEHEGSDLETENDEDFLSSEVPLSSSPPDLTSSSPQSGGSDTSDDISASSTSSLDDYLAEPVSVSQVNPSFVNLPTGASLASNDFGTRLHCLLLLAIEERKREGQDLISRHGRTDRLCDYESNDCTFDSPEESSGVSDEGSNECRNANIEKTRSKTPKKGSECQDYFEPCSLSPSNDLQEVSPVCFTAVGVIEDHETRKSDPSKIYRLIKRAQSYRPAEEKDEPQIKRQKIARDQGLHAKDRIYAHRTASLRRADSLRSAPGDRSSVANDWVPTVPATPVQATPKQRGSTFAKTSEHSNVLIDPVPIIAPPEGHVAKLPLSSDTQAKIRLTRYLERETRGRDGILLGLCQRSPQWMGRGTTVYDWPLLPEKRTLQGKATMEWENALGIGRKRREAAINWLLDVLTSEAAGHTSSSVSCSSSSSKSLSCTSSSSKSSSILHSSGGSSSRCTTNTPEHNASHSGTRFNLQDQLENSPETRFHAAWMFLSYFHLTASPGSSAHNSRSSSKESAVDEEGLNLVVWDIAIACLAISVKFHRDFLDPLLPVFAYEYVALAPHHISREELESAHRDVLSAFDYKLGVTPQPVMDELWSALPSLRGLLDFDGGWKEAMAGAWTRLFIALDEPDVQCFLVSMLTVVALMDGIIESLTDHYCRAAVGKLKRRPTAEDHHHDIRQARKKSCAKAKEDAEGVFCDIQALTGITDVDLRECRIWMTGRDSSNC